MKRFVCVNAQKAAGFPVTAACEAAGVSASGYYDWCEREAAGPTERQVAEAELVALTRSLFDETDGIRARPSALSTPGPYEEHARSPLQPEDTTPGRRYPVERHSVSSIRSD